MTAHPAAPGEPIPRDPEPGESNPQDPQPETPDRAHAEPAAPDPAHAEPGHPDTSAPPDADADPEADGVRRGPAALSERDRAVLAVEARGWPGPGAKERAVREQLGISPTRYYQLLNALLDDPRAAEHDPVTVNRLRRVRQARRERR